VGGAGWRTGHGQCCGRKGRVRGCCGGGWGRVESGSRTMFWWSISRSRCGGSSPTPPILAHHSRVCTLPRRSRPAAATTPPLTPHHPPLPSSHHTTPSHTTPPPSLHHTTPSHTTPTPSPPLHPLFTPHHPSERPNTRNRNLAHLSVGSSPERDRRRHSA